jgi:hypothetical protein
MRVAGVWVTWVAPPFWSLMKIWWPLPFPGLFAINIFYWLSIFLSRWNAAKAVLTTVCMFVMPLSLLANIMTECSNCFQKCDRIWGCRFCILVQNLKQIVIILCTLTVQSWWSQWGVQAALHHHVSWRWLYDTVWVLGYDCPHSCSSFFSVGQNWHNNLTLKCYYRVFSTIL